MKKKVAMLPDGAITPRMIGMQNQRQLYYNWISDMPNVKKINGRYHKVTETEEAKKANG